MKVLKAVLLSLFFISMPSFALLDNAETMEPIAQQMVGAKLKAMRTHVADLEQAGGEAALPLLQALLEGKLFYRKSDEQLVIAERQEDKSYLITGLFTEISESVTKKDIKKVKTNNRLRSQIRKAIARVTLFSQKADIRKSAVANLMGDLNEENVELLSQVQETEKDKQVLELIGTALAVSQLKSEDAQARISAIKLLDGNLEPLVLNELNALLEKEESRAVINEAKKVIQNIEGKITFYGYIETLFFGLSLGSVLLLVAAGLAITFGVMGVINMAHGEMIMLGAYTTYVIQLLMPNNIGLSILVAIPAAFIVSASVGILIERGVIQFLKGRPLETLLATFGISLILQQLVRTIFSPLNRQVATPEFMSGAMEINPIFSITYNRLYILIFALVVFFILQLILKKTSLGLNVRAVSQNRQMARCMGIKTEWVDAMTFGLGSGIAGLAGVALSQITNVGPNLGQSYIIDSFMVVVFGGVGNLWGTLVGGFSLGVLNKFLEPATGAVLANIIVLVGIILFIQKRPKGLFPQKGRAAE